MAAPKILFIDDEEDIRTVVQLSLEAIGGYEVLLASSGAEGLEMAAKERPDAILLDVMMPGLNGPAVLERLGQDERCAHIPVIFLTAKSRPAEISRLKELGALEVLAKPFSPTGLADHVRRILSRVSPGRPDKLTLLDVEELYLERLKGRIQDLRGNLRRLEDEVGKSGGPEPSPDAGEVLLTLRHIFHNMAGSGATHGLLAVSQVARAAETCIKGYLDMESELSGEAITQIGAYIDELEDYQAKAI